MNPYYQDDDVTIYMGDCREIMPSLEAGSVHLLATDPPYFRTVDAEWDDPDSRSDDLVDLEHAAYLLQMETDTYITECLEER